MLLVYYPGGGCEDIVVNIYREEAQYLVAMEDQRIHCGSYYSIENFIGGFWRPASEYSDF